MTKYNRVQSGEWVYPIMKGYRLMCCDCGLVHRVDFKVVHRGLGHRVLLRAFRHDQATAAARRNMKRIKKDEK